MGFRIDPGFTISKSCATCEHVNNWYGGAHGSCKIHKVTVNKMMVCDSHNQNSKAICYAKSTLKKAMEHLNELH